LAPAFVAQLANHQGIGPKALEFLILTAGRTNEVLGARWSEIDLEAKLWIITAERMKEHEEHRVPITSISRTANDLRSSLKLLFPVCWHPRSEMVAIPSSFAFHLQ
jgi:integrase